MSDTQTSYSVFDDLGFKPYLDHAYVEIQALYLEDDKQWVISCHVATPSVGDMPAIAGYGAIHMLSEFGLYFSQRVRVSGVTVRSDNGRGFCGRADSDPYELFLQLEGIERRAPCARRSQGADSGTAAMILFGGHFRHELAHQSKNV
ncbi:hypothetical protein FVW20_04995 [Desulfovibrio oxamicus]|uniref:Transposase n=1 Tax=Nitratidesulfovibrio oxamicus TaxID=32016 RepID=A0ABS0J1T5_9BACT|nr:hypothetical protein [Nitratidesulfovibrio oxamicus]MBG3876399.1 hypothetical protein [Nitratidesulfovibrio oxamicus]